MNDWLKIIAGGGIGFGVGILLEPVKLYFRNWYEVKQLRNLVLNEMAENYQKLEDFIDYCETEPEYFIERKQLSFDTTSFIHATTQTMLFKQIQHTTCLDGVYRAVVYIQNGGG